MASPIMEPMAAASHTLASLMVARLAKLAVSSRASPNFSSSEMGSLLILVDASKRLAEGIAARQLVKAHSQHSVTSVHPPRTAD